MNNEQNNENRTKEPNPEIVTMRAIALYEQMLENNSEGKMWFLLDVVAVAMWIIYKAFGVIPEDWLVVGIIIGGVSGIETIKCLLRDIRLSIKLDPLLAIMVAKTLDEFNEWCKTHKAKGEAK